MAIFTATLRDEGVLDVTVTSGTITFNDHSNYDTNTPNGTGHEQSNFEDYRKLVIETPNGTEYVFSSIGDGDANLVVPKAQTLPLSTIYSYTSGDGVYRVTLYTVPTWDSMANYTVGMAVYYNAKLWKVLASSLNVIPGTDPSKWVEVTKENLPARYIYSERFAISCAAISCFMQYAKTVVCGFSILDCKKDICKDANFVKAFKLLMIINMIDTLAELGDWDSITALLNYSNQLCCCNG
jgi:hypothetical protein